MTVTALTGTGNVTTASSTSAASLACNKPSNTANKDLLVCFAYFRNSGGTVTAPSGWSQLGPLNTTNETFGAYYKPITNAAGEPGTYTWSTSGGSARLMLAIFRVTGARLNAPQDAAGALAAYTGTSSVTDPAVTAVSSNALLLAFFINNTGSSQPVSVFTNPASMTEVSQVSVGNSATPTAYSAIEVCAENLTASGATGTRTATISPAAANSCGFMVTIGPLAAGAANLPATSTLTADGTVLPGTHANLSASSVMSASASVRRTAAATLTATSSLSATPGVQTLNGMGSDGIWHPINAHELVSGSWVQS
jgi:hypothetical protein